MHSFRTPKGTELPFLNLKGKDYLQVAHRIVWFREEHPTWQITTEIKQLDHEVAVVVAKIVNEDGAVLAMGSKLQTSKGFPGGYLEKAESGAVGRALAFLGYGTAFAQELEENEEMPMSQLADSPLPKKNSPIDEHLNGMKKVFSNQFQSPVVTDAQVKRLYTIVDKSGWSVIQVKAELAKIGVASSANLNRKQYDELVNLIESNPKQDNIPH